MQDTQTQVMYDAPEGSFVVADCALPPYPMCAEEEKCGRCLVRRAFDRSHLSRAEQLQDDIRIWFRLHKEHCDGNYNMLSSQYDLELHNRACGYGHAAAFDHMNDAYHSGALTVEQIDAAYVKVARKYPYAATQLRDLFRDAHIAHRDRCEVLHNAPLEDHSDNCNNAFEEAVSFKNARIVSEEQVKEIAAEITQEFSINLSF